jgi:hypothetical protein
MHRSGRGCKEGRVLNGLQKIGKLIKKEVGQKRRGEQAVGKEEEVGNRRLFIEGFKKGREINGKPKSTVSLSREEKIETNRKLKKKHLVQRIE